MVEQSEDEIKYYYDSHFTRDDLLGEPSWHRDLVNYLRDVLVQLFRGQQCAIYVNLNFYHTSDPNEYPVDPDIAVIKGVARQLVNSWKIGKTGPAPQVVFEIAQQETWKRDVKEGFISCAYMDVEEYYVYDPEDPPLSGDAGHRLRGWQLVKGSRQMREIPPRADGSIWSQYLESLLVPDGPYLRLYDGNGQLRLTRTEAEAQRAEMEAEARQLAERQAAIEADARRLAERRAEMLAERLRSLGIDPDQI